jgi:hypothetical protein
LLTPTYTQMPKSAPAPAPAPASASASATVSTQQVQPLLAGDEARYRREYCQSWRPWGSLPNWQPMNVLACNSIAHCTRRRIQMEAAKNPKHLCTLLTCRTLPNAQGARRRAQRRECCVPICCLAERTISKTKRGR